MEDKSLYSEIEEFLILGPSIDNMTNDGNIESIFVSNTELLSRLSKKEEDEQMFKEKLQKKKTDVEKLYKLFDNSNVFEKHHQYVRTQYKLQLLTLTKAISQLEQCTNVVEIPTIILSIKNKIPEVLLERSNAYRLVQSVIQKKKAFLLEQFQKAFERQLTDEDTISSDTRSKRPVWEVFLEKSRDWLLAYSLVCILPASLTNASDSLLLNIYQESLDTALTPVWGRLFFHLQLARESKSTDQLLWSFYYTKSFIEMLLNLCTSITSAEPLQQVSNINYANAFQTQIVDKSLKFLKAHIAMILEECEIWMTPFGMQFVEEMIEFDEWLVPFQLEDKAGLCMVLYESKENFHQWMLLEQSLIHQNLSSVCILETAAFQPLFLNDDMNDRIAIAAATSTSTTSKSLCCYEGLYTCLTMFCLARERYALFPAPAQYLLSDIILEPMLCLSLGLLLYRIRSNYHLYTISIQNMEQVTSAIYEFDQALDIFNNSVQYFQCALGKDKQQNICSNSKRCKNRWTIVQNWMPKIFIAEQQKVAGFALSDLLKTALKISDKYKQDTKFEYRNEVMMEINRAIDISDIEESVIMTRGLAITLVNVLQNTFKNS